MSRINIAIDGPSAAGKSTIAKKLAARLGYVHLDTGAMYRCVGYEALQKGIDLDDENAVCRMLKDMEIVLRPNGSVFLNGEDVSHVIREDQVSLAASRVAKLAGVRRDLVARQQKMAEDKGFIMDGRDIGTVVLKDAEVKIFLTASAHARALRRLNQNHEEQIATGDLAEIEREIEARDYQDTHRSNSPLVKAKDAVEIDSSDLSIDEVVEKILQIAEPYLNKESSL